MGIDPDDAVVGRIGIDALADTDQHRVRVVVVPDQKMRHLPGIAATAPATTRSRLAGGVPWGTTAASTWSCSSSSISSWKISGRPVMHSISMNRVQMMLDHL